MAGRSKGHVTLDLVPPPRQTVYDKPADIEVQGCNNANSHVNIFLGRLDDSHEK